jgi:hypothetical protein
MHDYAAKIDIFLYMRKRKKKNFIYYLANFALNSFNRLAAC